VHLHPFTGPTAFMLGNEVGHPRSLALAGDSSAALLLRGRS